MPKPPAQPAAPVASLIDRVVAALSPRAGLRRSAARRALKALGEYDAATPARTRKFYRDGLSPNQLTQQSAEAIRAQARQLHRNHDISRGIVRTMVNNIVGPGGIGVEPQPRRADGSIHEEYAATLRRIWAEHNKRPEVTGRHTGAKVQRLQCLTWLRDGEAFAQELVGPVPGLAHGSALPLSLELFEPDLVPYGYQDGARIFQGVERNAWGRPIAYFVHKRHPGEGSQALYGSGDLKRIPAERVHHIALLDRIGQMRGISEFASVITRLEDIKDYEESERIAAKIAAALTGYVKRSNPDGYTGAATDENGEPVPRQINMAPGMIIDSLEVGEEIGLINSSRPNPNLVTFRQGQLRAIAAGWGASYSSISRDYGGTFSSQRQELVEQWTNYATLTDEFTGQFVQPWYESAVFVAIASGLAPVPKDVVSGTENDAYFVAQSMPWIDPVKEANAWVALVRAGFASEVEVLRKRGVNPRDMLEQTSAWRSEAAKRGLVFTSDGANSETGGEAAPEPAQASATEAVQAQAQATHALAGRMVDVVQAQGASFASAVAQSAARPVDLTVNMRQADAPAPTPITNQIDVHVPAQPAPHISNQVTVQPADVKVVAESAAPIVNITNDVQPAPVTVNNTHPARAVQTVEGAGSEADPWGP